MRRHRLTALAISAIHLVVSTLVPLTHTCCCGLSAGGPAGRPASATEVPWGLHRTRFCPCRLVSGGRTFRRKSAPAGEEPSTLLVDDTRIGGECLACAFLRASQSGAPDALETPDGQPGAAITAIPAIAGLSLEDLPADPPARAPPAAC
jgi:hypothetical protein